MTTKPAHTIRRGALEASFWENKGKNGAFYNVTFRRRYATTDGGFGSSDNFGAANLAELAFLVAQADQWIRSQGKTGVDADTDAAA